jgi:hypothetical protein
MCEHLNLTMASLVASLEARRATEISAPSSNPGMQELPGSGSDDDRHKKCLSSTLAGVQHANRPGSGRRLTLKMRGRGGGQGIEVILISVVHYVSWQLGAQGSGTITTPADCRSARARYAGTC